ncbi:MAG: hypothetical protein WD601_07035 [Pseudohongiellaceae bacterium]
MKNFKLALAATLLMPVLIISGFWAVNTNAAFENPAPTSKLPVPVSINAIMVTMVDHSAHYIWDYADDTQFMGDTEWQAIEYYAIQLAAAGPLITLGGTGPNDNAWVDSAQWTRYARLMMTAAELAQDAGRLHDSILLDTAGDMLVESCEGCHQVFKPDLPTEGLAHEPYYDDLYHLFLSQPRN